MTTHVTLLADMTVRAIIRRRLTVALLVIMPVAFYAVTHESVGRAVRSLVFGLSWTVSTVAFFAAISARRLGPRLGLAGWTRRQLVAGRLVGLIAAAATLVALFSALVAVDQPAVDAVGVTVSFLTTAAVAVAIGTALGALVERELEGTLALFLVAGLQAVINAFDTYARALPFWSSRELATWAVDGPEVGSLGEGLIHATAVVVVCAVIVMASTTGRSAVRID